VEQDERTALERARAGAFPPGQDVGQQSFVLADEVRQLAARARIGARDSVLDVCCGIGGPGRLVTAETGCRYLGVDASADAVATARRLAGDLPCRFEQATVPPLPAGPFDVVLLLETVLAFRDKRALLAAVAGALGPGGRFVLTLEEGAPLTAAERARMPAADTVWPVPWAEFTGLLADAGLAVTWHEDHTAAHRATAAALLGSYRDAAPEIAEQLGERACADLLAAHELWAEWLGSGRVRKVAAVAEKVADKATHKVADEVAQKVDQQR
jgi:SAM-dependent methyltransferase